jgi:hypothetical protein
MGHAFIVNCVGSSKLRTAGSEHASANREHVVPSARAHWTRDTASRRTTGKTLLCARSDVHLPSGYAVLVLEAASSCLHSGIAR